MCLLLCIKIMAAIWICLLFIPQATSSPSVNYFNESNITIKAPSHIVALTRDVTVVIGGAEQGGVVDVYYEDDTSPIIGQIITRRNEQDKKDVTLVFDCGYFSRLGDYRFLLRDLSTGIVFNETTTVSATEWPDIKLEMKSVHEAFTTDVKVSITSPADICSSGVVTQYNTQLVLLRDNAVVMATDDVTFPPASIYYECDVFTRPGNYVAQLRMASMNDDVIVRESEVMRVDWSSEYSLEVPVTIFPCKQRRINIRIHRPPCVPNDDVIQAVAMFNNGSYYVITNVTIGNLDEVTFICSRLYSSRHAPGVCFRYVTSHEVTRTVCRRKRTHRTFSVDGNWSIWSYWGTCMRPCTNPIRRRTRSCDNPKPSGRGLKCTEESMQSDGVQYQLQNSFFGGQRPSCPLEGVTSSNMTSECVCGCAVSALDSGIFSSPISGQCPSQDTMKWTFYTTPENLIRFRVIDFQLKFGEVVTMKDDNVATTITSESGTVTSSFYVVTISYTKSLVGEVTDSCGFVLSYESIERSKVMTTTPPSAATNSSETPINANKWIDDVIKNPVTAGGIAACVVVIVLVVSVAVIRCRKQQIKDRTREQNVEMSMHNRLTTPPDGKSSSNLDAESDRPAPVGENSRDTDVPVTPKPRAAYYLAQRQLELMKKEGKENSSQMYAASCMNDDTIREQEALLFGPIHNQSDAST